MDFQKLLKITLKIGPFKNKKFLKKLSKVVDRQNQLLDLALPSRVTKYD